MTCSTCGTENRAGRRFCSSCGTPLEIVCPHCGASNEPDDRFCGECGNELAAVTTGDTGSDRDRPIPVSERKLVSVLFADLVGFTTLSESRDPEEVRELLTRYFETARTLIERYGGTIEKFIGDAVMAVWGAPVTQEDDAERAVRAGLELVTAVTALGSDVGADLTARAGVATGETAVTLAAEGQGMVAGDLVNTAARVQTAASPGTVFVTDVTRRASDAAIAYEDAGTHELKGKAVPMPLARAMRVIALRGGELRSMGLESPFVGRDREMRLIKDLFHAGADEGRAHLVSVVGIGGIGKSRLSWEFLKYIDGLMDTVWWHRGRCLAYGEGITYWALSEMVRSRAGIGEDEPSDTAGQKLRACVEEWITDPEERRWVEPRLAHLLGLEERTAWSRDDLFSGWRLFFERIADRGGPTVMVFEDVQWADDALLDFVDHLAERARDHPLIIVTLARPELIERRPDWGVGKHRFTSLYLEPLPDAAIDELLRGMVPGLPDDLLVRVRERAEGVPLYAVETVRMLLDKGLLARGEGEGYELTGSVDELEVPGSLQGLIAARLDGLPSEERALLQDGAVLGKTFPRQAIASLSDLPDDRLDELLSALVRKEFLSIQSDPRATDHGQYGFLQSLVQKVAYDTLAKKDRRTRHLAAAENLEQTWTGDEDEIVEVIAAHYTEAYRSAPDEPDAERVRAKARDALTRGGRRAQQLAAPRAARGYFLRAAELADTDGERASLLELAGIMASVSATMDEAMHDLEEAEALFRSEGRTHDAARVSARIGDVSFLFSSKLDDALVRMTSAFDILKNDEPDEDLAALAAQLGRLHFFAGHLEVAAEAIELALGVAESLWLPETISEAMNTKGLIASARGRPEEALALIRRSLEVGLENDTPSAALRAYFNLANEMFERDRYEESTRLDLDAIALAQRLGWSGPEWFARMQIIAHQFLSGSWDEVLITMREALESEDPGVRAGIEGIAWGAMEVARNRGDVEEVNRCFAVWEDHSDSDDLQARAIYAVVRAIAAEANGDVRGTLGFAQEAFDLRDALSHRHGAIKWSYPIAVDAALKLGDLAAAEALVSTVEGWKPGQISPLMRALTERFRARLAPSEPETDGRFKSATGLFREIGAPFYRACTLLEHSEWLVANGRLDDAAPLLAEAREIFERLEATPWVARADAIAPSHVGT